MHTLDSKTVSNKVFWENENGYICEHINVAKIDEMHFLIVIICSKGLLLILVSNM